MGAITCAVDGCTDHPTENVIVHTAAGVEVHIQTCMDHVSDVGFGLDHRTAGKVRV